ncbi:hypothetical protein LEN26_009502 [Aphanomyces euteiches]|nr:hypothetical protein LEN26_009502 [Aphanomyces euteiches]
MGCKAYPSSQPSAQSTLRIACAVMELCLKFRINKEDILTTGEMVARITRSIVFQRARQDEAFQLDNLATVLANTHAYLDETLEATKGWNLLIDKTTREKMAKSITTHIAQYQEDIRRAASFLLVNFNIEIVGSVDDLMQDMQAMMDKLGKMDYYISLAQSNVTPNRQVDNLLEMAIQLQRGLDHYYHNINLRNVQANHTFEASVLASFDKVVHAAKDSWRASKLTQDLPLDEMIQEWMLASDDVVYDPNNESTFLGQGASAAVYLGQYKGRNVAVKHFNTIKVADSAEFEASIRKEIKAWRDVANKPHILTLIGVCTKVASPIVVCEYCPDTITRYIRYRPEKLVEMVYQLAIGLLSLHSAGIIHRDIKDFGLSRSTESLLTQYSNARFVGTLNWMSPEQRFSPRKVTVQSDVRSFGMTVWQLMTGDLPYRDYCQEEIEEAIRSQDDSPGRPEDLRKDYEALWNLITWCWKLNPSNRPKAKDVVDFLENHYRQQLKLPSKSNSMVERKVAETIEWENNVEHKDLFELRSNIQTNKLLEYRSHDTTEISVDTQSIPNAAAIHDKATNASIRGSIPGVSEPILWQTSEEVSFDEFSSQSDEVSVIDLATIRINAQEIDLVRVVDHSLISEMWSGMYRGTHVTIKKLRQNNATPSKLKTFIQHIQLMATFDSPFIVQLVGAAWNHPRDLMCIMEWMDGGNLREYLNATTDEVFSWQAKYEIIHHLVEGLLYLHSMYVIHSDVKSRNVLLDSLKPAKLANVNTMEMSVEDTMIAQLATFRWMAPEVILDESYSSASDVYSFGVVLAELDTHRVSYRDIIHPESGERLTDTMIIEQVATGSLQPTFNSYCPEWILFMALQCLSYNPEDRPTALQLAEIVRANLMDL